MPRPRKSIQRSIHQPVLLQECMLALQPELGHRFVDATVGGGGHAAALLASSSKLKLLAMDRDADALTRAQLRLEEFGDRVQFVHAPFSALAEHLPTSWGGQFDGLLADFGLSSDQLEEAERGFSFQQDGPLDMRMDATTQKTSAGVLLATASSEELETWFREYGEERHARRLAHEVVRARRFGPLLRTTQLADLVSRIVPRGRASIHPATRTFQALRIAVNHELDEISALLDIAPGLMAPGARLAAISFHSLEDRLVKQAFRHQLREGGHSLPHAKGVCASAREKRENPRARSARLRCLVRDPEACP